MRALGVHHMIASCLNNACGHQTLIDVSRYPDDFEVTWFGRHAVCNKCGAKAAPDRRAAELERKTGHD